MEEQLRELVEENAPLSGFATLDATLRPENVSVDETWNGSPNTSICSAMSRRSILVENAADSSDPRLRVISDGATRFLHHQIVEIANDCLCKSRDDLINTAYFSEISQRLEAVLSEAHEKTSVESFAFLSKIVKNLLMVISRPARILECLVLFFVEFFQLDLLVDISCFRCYGDALTRQTMLIRGVFQS
ncbi:unnamed protein product [Gongylonema pulchrum]|uniref:DUF1908 domain-containing protein n=1 Tax=Gongylonema pulchrum TaxID=637853 RepID=A0A183E6E1_9BILA|nr:unnamed protein product [Gongylonema pulchrum]